MKAVYSPAEIYNVSLVYMYGSRNVISVNLVASCIIHVHCVYFSYIVLIVSDTVVLETFRF